MYRRFIPVAVIALMLISGATAYAQCGCSAAPAYEPVAPTYTSYYAAPVAYEAPASYASYYAPPVAYAPTSYASYYAPPAVAVPTPYVSYYAAHHRVLCTDHGVLCTHDGILCSRRGALSGLLRGAGLEHLRNAAPLRAGRTGAERRAGNYPVNNVRFIPSPRVTISVSGTLPTGRRGEA